MNSLRESIITALYETPAADANALLATAGYPTDIHNFVHQIRALQKHGEVTFKERKGQGSDGVGDLVDITLTDYGTRTVKRMYGEEIISPYDRPYITITWDELAKAVDTTPIVRKPYTKRAPRTPRILIDEPKELPWSPDGRLLVESKSVAKVFSGKHKIGKDPTDYRNHPAKALGGEITREQAPREVTPAMIEAAEVMERVLQPVWTFVLSDYPLIEKLFGERDKVAQAAQLLREVGMPDMADQAERSYVLTELEEEVVKLVRQLVK